MNIITNIAVMILVLISSVPLRLAAGEPPDRLIKAADVAISSYSKNISERHTTPGADGDYMRNIHSYNIGISQNSRYFVFVFLPRNKNFSGGGGEVWVSKENMRVEKTANYF
ncbi:hypothetical protein [Lysobacter gummosus]|uniref:Secreted protein n=1 Tax=Lysobacter gummosus TaxID=262324 RepID=A0ABY3XG43_9GAMM|nr:hypothetical protein [Lysobacter gummosus]UNP30614.1 hypothetical protein MOV92_04940 [Lysobacter gummosus]